MGKVRLLDETTANKIAAGEVVERPAAVVKELVENALDAFATRIDVQIAGGGLELIRVVDNGRGMAAEDIPLALQRHATSKIMRAEDLSTVLTMGFRGEALPSIAAVSRFRLVSRRNQDEIGREIVVHGGKTIHELDAGCPAGTEVKAEDLFYNTPARLKFMKSVGSETAKITDVVQRLALAWPGVSFTFTVNGKNKIITPGNGSLEDVTAQILGRKNMREMVPLKWKGGLISLHGYVAKPSLCRANRNLQYFCVNQRPIRSPMLSDALQTAYHTLLPRNRFPAAVIMLELDPTEVDVNVHPAKREVRFSQERDIYRQLLAGVKSALQDASLIGEVYRPWQKANQETAANLSLHDYGIAVKPVPPSPAIPSDTHSTNIRYKAEEAPQSITRQEPVCAETKPQVQKAAPAFPELQPLGQYRSTYILAQAQTNDLYIIDQHAAHERILYDAIKIDISRGKLPPVQEILPQSFELDAQSAAALTESLNLFAEMGLNFETFGNNTFILRSVPVFFHGNLKHSELMDLLMQSNPDENDISIFEKSLQMMACKAAIKANQPLDRTEMTTLLQNLAQTTQPHTCPHGRPTVMVLSEQTIARNFRRI